ncbi:MAG: GNAT family N-acetyltransferase [Phycisphaerae bacterium]
MNHQEDLKLVRPAAALQPSYEAYVRAFPEGAEIPGNSAMAACLADAPSFGRAVERCLGFADGTDLPEGWVCCEAWWLVRNGNEIVGTIDLRHSLTPFLESEGGSIGYAVHPDSRNRGYATEMLREVLQRARRRGTRRVLVTCDQQNAASAAVIRKCGGVLENEVPSVLEGREVTQRYRIDLR